jgi:hypothetical protein
MARAAMRAPFFRRTSPPKERLRSRRFTRDEQLSIVAVQQSFD